MAESALETSIDLSGNSRMKTRQFLLLATLLPMLAFVFSASSYAQTTLPWERNTQAKEQSKPNDGRTFQEPGQEYNPAQHSTSQQEQGDGGNNSGSYDSGYDALRNNGRSQQGYRDPQPRSDQRDGNYDNNQNYQAPRQNDDQQREYPPRQGYQPPANQGPGQAYAPPSRDNYDRRPAREPDYDDTFSDDEVLRAGHSFFGKITKGLAKVISHVFKKSGRPTAYILGEEGGGALIAGLRYGEGTLYTKSGERRRIYWQGPSIGYDFGAEGAKTMILVYNLHDIDKMYGRFAGVDGSAYLVGGIGVTFQKRGRVTLAPIRSGVGVRLGANIGYLKYTRRPTWNPF
jgi:hypothetical protein